MYLCYYGPTSLPGFSTPAGRAREEWYQVGVEPTAVFDGRLGPQVPQPDSFYPVYRDMIDGARSRPTSVEMELDTALTRADSQQVTLALRIVPTDSSLDTAGNLRLVAVVYEDSVPYDFMGDTLYARLVTRAVVADTFGIPLALKFGQEFETTLVVPVQGWSPARLGSAVFVQDRASKAVLQSVGRRFSR